MPSDRLFQYFCRDRSLDPPDEDEQMAKADKGKPRLTLCPPEIIEAVARVREYGCAKYPDGGPNNWRRVSPERFSDALFRHFLSYIKNPQGRDPESGLPHLWHVACNVAFLCVFYRAYHDDEGKNGD